MFNVCFLSPPVPQVSTIVPLVLILIHLSLNTFTADTNSLWTIPFNDKATKNLAISVLIL